MDVIPDWVHERTPIEPQEWLPDSLHINNCTYRSTGRFGIILKASNALIENTLFENNVAGIQMEQNGAGILAGIYKSTTR